jgi:diguanylate cyclase (GGDEF)-like protein/PAS domain S-box-containing protein
MSDLGLRPQDLGIGHLFEKVREAVIVVDAITGRIVLWNWAATRIFGYSPSEALELRIESLIPERLQAEISRYRETGRRVYVDSHGLLELAATRKGGEEIWVEMSLSPIAPVRDLGEADGRFVLAIARDVTERKRAYDQLAESERRFATVLSNSRAYVYRCLNEPGYPNEFASDYALELTGYPPEDLLVGGKVRFGELIVEEDRQRVWEEIQAALGRGERFELRYAIRRRDGEIREVEEFGQGVCDQEGNVVALEGILYEVTERERAEERLREAEQRYRTLIEQIPAIVYIEEMNGRMTTLYDSPQIEDMLGYPQGKHLGDPDYWLKIIHPDDRERVLAEDRRVNAMGEPFGQEYRVVASDGRVVWVHEEAVVVRNEAREPLYWQGFIFDITERKEAEEALRRSEASLAQAQRMAHLGNWEWDVRTGEVWWSDEVFRIYGYGPREFVPSHERLMDVVHPEDRGLLRRKIDGALYDGEPYDFEHRIIRPGGEARVVHHRAEVVRGQGGEPLRMVGTVHDITERKALQEQLEYQALHDALTGLPNRALFMDRLQHALVRAWRRKGEVAVLFMDLDNFKVVNDSLGHDAGDSLLAAVAERLRARLRPEDTAARLGGDEFVILLEDLTDVGEATRVAERIAEALRTAFVLNRREVFVTASIGVVLSDDARKEPADLLRNADLAMYRAKHAGRARYEVFEEQMSARALERLQMENDLRRAVERQEFVVHYQPVVALDTGGVKGFEALVRWERSEDTLIVPEEFVPVAEDTGLIVPIGQWTLREACRQAQEWRRRYPDAPSVTMFVNLSARQLQDPDLARRIAQITRETGFDPRYLELEISEGAAMVNAPATAAVLEELKALDVRVAIDDFGTGYSSLSYLERFPVDSLKIDRSFVDKLGQDPGTALLVSGMIDLAHALGLRVIAEGVETTEQLQRVRDLGCDLAQGYHFSRPLPDEAAGVLLKTRVL